MDMNEVTPPPEKPNQDKSMPSPGGTQKDTDTSDFSHNADAAPERAGQNRSFSAREAPPEEKKPEKNRTKKIAIFATACVVVLGLSVWGLASALNAGDLTASTQERQNDASSTTSAVRGDDQVRSGASDETEASATSSEESGGAQGSAAGETADSQNADATGGGASDQSQGSQAGGSQQSTEATQAIAITLNIRCDEAVAAGNANAIAISDNGAIRSVSLRLNAGSTVYDALIASGVSIGSTTSSVGIYITSINGLSQFEVNSQSGWKYYVNGSAPQYSCDRYTLSDGDYVEWRYVLSS